MRDGLEEIELGDELVWEPARLVPPDPWTGHLPFAFWLVKALRPRTFVELGTHSGNSYFAFCQAMAAFVPGGRAYAVDTWAGDEHAGSYGEEVFADVAAFNAAHFRQFSTLLRTTFDDARGYFPDGGIDLLHIDGLHTYEAVRHDFETWQAALSPRAVVLFHDINVRERQFGVWRVWQELRACHPAFEFDHSHGLGVLGMGPEQAPALRALFALAEDPETAGRFRRRLAARGEAFQRQVTILELQAQLRAAAAAAGAQGAELAASRAELAWHAALLASQRAVIEAKQAMVASLGDVAAARAHALAERDRLIESRDALASRLFAELRQQTLMVGEERRVRAEMQAGYERALREGEAAMDRAVAEATRFFTSSRSWKLTRPLRLARRRVRGPELRPGMPPLLVPAPPAALAAPDVGPVADVTATTPAKHALRTMLRARLEGFLAGRETLRLPCSEAPAVSILLVLYNQAELTFGCLASIVETLTEAPFGVEVVIADNASTDATAALLGRLEGARIIRNPGNLHFLRAANQAARAAHGRTLLLLNNDAQLLPGAVAAALRTLDSDAAIGAVGGRIILPDGTLQEAGSIIWRDGACSAYGRGRDPNDPDFMFQRDVDYCSGAFLLTRAALFHDLGGFDARYAPAYYEETDYCVRLWEGGWRVVYDPEATIIHYEFGSSGESGEALRLQAANHATFAAQHAAWLARQFPASPLNVLAARTARTGRLRLLAIDDRVPKPELGTGYPRANRLLHELVAAGADVTLFPMFRHCEDWHGVRRALDTRIEVLIAAEAAQLRDYLLARQQHFDAILVCRPHNMRAFLEAIGPERELLGGATLLYDAEALFATRDLQRRAAAGEPATAPERRALIAEEVALTRLAETVISVSSAEQQQLEDYGARDVRLLGHALDEAPVPTGYHERDAIVFVGAIQDDHAPNADAVRWFADAVLPRLREALGQPDLRLTVIGRNDAATVAALDGTALTLVGMVDDLRAALARARVMVVPSRLAAGLPHKVHEAAMLGIPLVATSLIAAQAGWTDGDELLVADDPAAFAAACARLYADAALWERLRGNALARVRHDCAPEAFSAAVREILAGVRRVHREPDPPPPLPAPAGAPPVAAAEPNTSRPAASDWSAAVPFGYLPPAAHVRVAVLAHLYHTAVAPELRFYLRNLPDAADLFVSTDTAAKRAALAAVFAGWERGAVELRVMPNRGRDIAPKLVGFAEVHDRYDLVLHVHSKVSDHAPFLAPWRSYLFETLLGAPEVVRSILGAFAQLPDLGMVAPQHYAAVRRWLGWNGNFQAAQALAGRMGIALSPHRALDFPSGSMFWARPAALRPLLDLKLRFEDFPAEGAQLDHTPAHAIERLFFYCCERSGHSWLKVAQPALCWDTSTVAEIVSPEALSAFAAEHGVALGGPAPIETLREPAPMMTRVPPGLARRLADRRF